MCSPEKPATFFMAGTRAGLATENDASCGTSSRCSRSRIFAALQPGAQKRRDGIYHSAADLKLGDKFGAKIELTGPVAMNDDQFLRHSAKGALRDTLTSLLGALIILWLALRSWKIVAAVFFSLMVGLAVTAATRSCNGRSLSI